MPSMKWNNQSFLSLSLERNHFQSFQPLNLNLEHILNEQTPSSIQSPSQNAELCDLFFSAFQIGRPSGGIFSSNHRMASSARSSGTIFCKKDQVLAFHLANVVLHIHKNFNDELGKWLILLSNETKQWDTMTIFVALVQMSEIGADLLPVNSCKFNMEPEQTALTKGKKRHLQDPSQIYLVAVSLKWFHLWDYWACNSHAPKCDPIGQEMGGPCNEWYSNWWIRNQTKVRQTVSSKCAGCFFDLCFFSLCLPRLWFLCAAPF